MFHRKQNQYKGKIKPESTTEVQNAIHKALQAFQEIKYPVTKIQLIEEAKRLNARSEVIKTFEACSDREYTNFSDVMHPHVPENDKY